MNQTKVYYARAIRNHLSNSQDPITGSPPVFEMNPWEWTRPIPEELRTKDAYKAWCNNENTHYAFITAWVGRDGGRRVAKNNPPIQLLGLIADYDVKQSIAHTDEEVAAAIGKMVERMRPMAWNRTFSNGIRMVWAFETPIWIPGEDFQDAILKMLKKDLKLEACGLTRLDEATFNPSQVFCCGNNWKVVGNIVPQEVVTRWIHTARKQWDKKQKHDAGDLGDIRGALLAKNPDWDLPEEFEEGKPIGRFWDPSHERKDSGIICKNGVLYWTNGGGFMPWTASELLGKDYAKQVYEDTVGKALREIYFDGRLYWKMSREEDWHEMSKDDAALALSTEYRLSRHKTKFDLASPAEEVLAEIQRTKRVDGALEMPFRPAGYIELNGRKFLNTSKAKVIQPALVDEIGFDDPRCAWLYGCFTHVLPSIPALHNFLWWVKALYEECLEYRPGKGHVMIITGPAHGGKSFLLSCVIPTILGSVSNVESFLKSGDMKNVGYIMDNYYWLLDDPFADEGGNRNLRSRFTNFIKTVAVVETLSWGKKYRGEVTVPHAGRCAVAMNASADTLELTPDLSQHVADKFSMIQTGDQRLDLGANREATQEQVRQELPFFLRALQCWGGSEHIKFGGRFGFHAYHDPELYRDAIANSSLSQAADLLHLFRQTYWERRDGQKNVLVEAFEGTATEILAKMQDCELIRTQACKLNARRYGRELTDLAESDEYPWISKRMLNGRALYRISVG